MHFRQVDEICWPCKKEKLALQRFLKYSSFYRAHKKKKDSFSSCRHTCWTSMKVYCPFLSLISDKLIMLSTCNNSQTFHVFLSPIFSSMMDCQFSLYNLFGLISICSGRIYIYIYMGAFVALQFDCLKNQPKDKGYVDQQIAIIQHPLVLLGLLCNLILAQLAYELHNSYGGLKDVNSYPPQGILSFKLTPKQEHQRPQPIKEIHMGEKKKKKKKKKREPKSTKENCV